MLGRFKCISEGVHVRIEDRDHLAGRRDGQPARIKERSHQPDALKVAFASSTTSTFYRARS
jgi:hypothetical protein